MGFLSKVFKAVKKVAKVAIPVALAYVTGGTSQAILSAGMQVAGGALKSQPKASPVTGAISPTSGDSTSSAAAAQEAEASKATARKLALNASGYGSEPVTSLAAGSLKTTKKKLLGM